MKTPEEIAQAMADLPPTQLLSFICTLQTILDVMTGDEDPDIKGYIAKAMTLAEAIRRPGFPDVVKQTQAEVARTKAFEPIFKAYDDFRARTADETQQ